MRMHRTHVHSTNYTKNKQAGSASTSIQFMPTAKRHALHLPDPQVILRMKPGLLVSVDKDDLAIGDGNGCGIEPEIDLHCASTPFAGPADRSCLTA